MRPVRIRATRNPCPGSLQPVSCIDHRLLDAGGGALMACHGGDPDQSPLALVGGLVAVLISGGVLSVASLIGFITLFGMAVRNGLLLVDNFNRRHQRGEPLMELIRNGSLERLNAILMTALTSSLGMLPLALAFGAGTEILQALAIVVFGGLITSTLLSLVVIPALYARHGRWLLPS